jgi:hypothetical protein
VDKLAPVKLLKSLNICSLIIKEFLLHNPEESVPLLLLKESHIKWVIVSANKLVIMSDFNKKDQPKLKSLS